MTALSQLGLFLSSFSPLFAVFGLLNSFGAGWPSWACYAIACVGIAILPGLFRHARRLSPQMLRIHTAESRDGDVLAYIATYLVPFAATNATTGRERAALGLFLLMIAVLYVRAELFYVNPLLAAIGYRLFQVTTPSDTSALLLTRRHFLTTDSVLKARRLSAYVYWERNDEQPAA